MKAVILTGGLGTRLQPYTLFVPKPMLPLGDKPLLEHSINWLKKNNVKSVVLCVSYLRRNIQNYFQNGEDFGVEIEYAVSNKPLATAGQLKTAEEFIDDDFVCMYGDSIFDFSLKDMIKQHQKNKSFITMCLYEYKSRLPYGVIDTNKNNIITAWREKPEIVSNINTGCYVMDPGVFPLIPKDVPYGMDKVIQKAMTKKEKLNGFSIKKGFTDVGDMPSYEKTYQEFKDKLGKI